MRILKYGNVGNFGAVCRLPVSPYLSFTALPTDLKDQNVVLFQRAANYGNAFFKICFDWLFPQRKEGKDPHARLKKYTAHTFSQKQNGANRCKLRQSYFRRANMLNPESDGRSSSLANGGRGL